MLGINCGHEYTILFAFVGFKSTRLVMEPQLFGGGVQCQCFTLSAVQEKKGKITAIEGAIAIGSDKYAAFKLSGLHCEWV